MTEVEVAVQIDNTLEESSAPKKTVTIEEPPKPEERPIPAERTSGEFVYTRAKILECFKPYPIPKGFVQLHHATSKEALLPFALAPTLEHPDDTGQAKFYSNSARGRNPSRGRGRGRGDVLRSSWSPGMMDQSLRTSQDGLDEDNGYSGGLSSSTATGGGGGGSHYNPLASSVDSLMFEDGEEPTWEYKDPQGDIHGPFSSSQMNHWYQNGYFPSDLSLKSSVESQYAPLSSRLHDRPNPFAPLPPINSSGPRASLYRSVDSLEEEILSSSTSGLKTSSEGVSTTTSTLDTTVTTPPVNNNNNNTTNINSAAVPVPNSNEGLTPESENLLEMLASASLRASSGKVPTPASIHQSPTADGSAAAAINSGFNLLEHLFDSAREKSVSEAAGPLDFARGDSGRMDGVWTVDAIEQRFQEAPQNNNANSHNFGSNMFPFMGSADWANPGIVEDDSGFLVDPNSPLYYPPHPSDADSMFPSQTLSPSLARFFPMLSPANNAQYPDHTQQNYQQGYQGQNDKGQQARTEGDLREVGVRGRVGQQHQQYSTDGVQAQNQGQGYNQGYRRGRGGRGRGGRGRGGRGYSPKP